MRNILILIFMFSVILFGKQSSNALMDSLEKKDVKKAIELINSGADINSKDRMGETPLIEASEEGLTEVVIITNNMESYLYFYLIFIQMALRGRREDDEV